jgi:signal transduction histidine kinase
LVVEARLLEPAGTIVSGLVPERASVPILLFVITSLLTLAIGWTFVRQMRLDALRADFMAGVSHQFHTPLALISAYAETSASGRAIDEHERGQFMQLIRRESQRLSHLVDNVLRVSTAGETTTAISGRLVALQDVVATACADFALLAAARDCTITTCLSANASVAGSDIDIRNALFNVLDNAVRYGGEGQTIHVALVGSSRGVDLTIDDQGPGIPPRDRERAFRRFERLTSALGPDASAGTGIGLTIVRDIVAESGGSAVLDTAPGGGTRVRLKWPAHAIR